MRSEFEFIRNIKKTYSLGLIGDDCAVLPKNADADLIVTADMLVEDIDFRLNWTSGEFLGHKALAVSLSDVAAMGGEPNWAMLTLGVPEKLWNSNFLEDFYRGWYQLAEIHGVELAGGDISRTPDKLVIDSIVGGDVPIGRAILRSGARPDDAVVVTGSLGASAGGLILLQNDSRIETADTWKRDLLLSHLKAEPRTETASFLQDFGSITALIDISDGLSSDLGHICEASGVGALINAASIPVAAELKNLFASFEDRLDLALNGGEDFQLLFTLPQNRIADLIESSKSRPGIGPFTVIGEITSRPGVLELANGEIRVVELGGFRHF